MLASLCIGWLLMHDPCVCQFEQLGHRQQIVCVEAVGFPPGVVALLVAPAGDDAVPGSFVDVFRQIVTCRTPRRILCAGGDICVLLLFTFPASTTGPYEATVNRCQDGAERTGQAKGRRIPLAESGLGSFIRVGGVCSVAGVTATVGGGFNGRRGTLRLSPVQTPVHGVQMGWPQLGVRRRQSVCQRSTARDCRRGLYGDQTKSSRLVQQQCSEGII